MALAVTDLLDAQQWSSYWAKGTITTFLGRFRDNYEGAVADFWHDQFARCPADACIVDLAAGNGALASLAVGYSDKAGQSFEVAAVDYADINPMVQFADQPNLRSILARVEFHRSTPIERTGLADDRFDLAISQFGFEYADPTTAVAELSRILKPAGARFAALMHHKDSAIVTQAKEGLRQAKSCLATGAADTAAQLMRRVETVRRGNRSPEQDSECERLRAQLNGQTGHLHDVQQHFSDPTQIAFLPEALHGALQRPAGGPSAVGTVCNTRRPQRWKRRPTWPACAISRA